jgi:hypothetical protein
MPRKPDRGGSGLAKEPRAVLPPQRPEEARPRPLPQRSRRHVEKPLKAVEVAPPRWQDK